MGSIRAGLVGVALLALVWAPGCGDETHETGTVVQTTPDMEKEAQASDNFMAGQAKAKKKGTPKAPDGAPEVLQAK